MRAMSSSNPTTTNFSEGHIMLITNQKFSSKNYLLWSQSIMTVTQTSTLAKFFFLLIRNLSTLATITLKFKTLEKFGTHDDVIR